MKAERGQSHAATWALQGHYCHPASPGGVLPRCSHQSPLASLQEAASKEICSGRVCEGGTEAKTSPGTLLGKAAACYGCVPLGAAALGCPMAELQQGWLHCC